MTEPHTGSLEVSQDGIEFTSSAARLSLGEVRDVSRFGAGLSWHQMYLLTLSPIVMLSPATQEGWFRFALLAFYLPLYILMALMFTNTDLVCVEYTDDAGMDRSAYFRDDSIWGFLGGRKDLFRAIEDHARDGASPVTDAEAARRPPAPGSAAGWSASQWGSGSALASSSPRAPST